MAPVAQHLDVAVHVFTAEGQRAYAVNVHPVHGEVTQAPVAPGRAPFLHASAKPRGSVPAVRPSQAPCSSGTGARPSLVRPVTGVAASAVRGGPRCSRYNACASPWWASWSCSVSDLIGNMPGPVGPVPMGIRSLVVVCPPPDSDRATLRGSFRVPPRGPVPRTASRWVSGLGRHPGAHRGTSGRHGAAPSCNPG